MELEKYTLQKQLGEGTFGKVTKWVYRNESLVVKTFKSDESWNVSMSALREISCLTQIKPHENIIHIMGVSLDKYMKYQMIMEELDGTLDELLQNTNPTFTESIDYYIMLCNGVRYMHSFGFIHRDLKPPNILCNYKNCSKLILKIADMGLSTRYFPGKTLTIEVQTLWWRAPEVLLGNNKYSFKIDYWSVGVIFLQIINYRAIKPYIAGDSCWGQLIKIFQLCGYPSEKKWPGVTKLIHWNEKFPQIKQMNLNIERFNKYQNVMCLQIKNRCLSLDPCKRILYSFSEDAYCHFKFGGQNENENAHIWDMKIRVISLLYIYDVWNWFSLKSSTFETCVRILDDYFQITGKFNNTILVSISYIAACIHEYYELSITDLEKYTNVKTDDIEKNIFDICSTLNFELNNKLLSEHFGHQNDILNWSIKFVIMLCPHVLHNDELSVEYVNQAINCIQDVDGLTKITHIFYENAVKQKKFIDLILEHDFGKLRRSIISENRTDRKVCRKRKKIAS